MKAEINFILKRRAGFTLVEVLIATVIGSIVMVIASDVFVRLVRQSNSVNESVNNLVLNELSLRGFRAQVNASHLQRQNLMTCSGQTLLSRDEVGGTASNLILENSGDSLTFVYTNHSLLAATDADVESSLKVSDVGNLRKGNLLYLTSLDADKLRGLFRIKSVSPATNSIKLEDALPKVPSEIPCSLNPSPLALNPMLSRLQIRKFQAEAVKVVSYKVTGNENTKSLSALSWNGTQTDRSVIVSLFRSLGMGQNYLRNSESNGTYQATAEVAYYLSSPLGSTMASGIAQKETIRLNMSYQIAALDVSNKLGVAEPAINEDIAATCSLSRSLIQGTFARSFDGEQIPVYQIWASYTESDKLKGGRTPRLVMTVKPKSRTSGLPVRCWLPNEVIDAVGTSPFVKVLMGQALRETAAFRPVNIGALAPRVSGSGIDSLLVEPIYCEINDPSTVTAQMSYYDGLIGRQRNITCSPVEIDPSSTKRDWIYQYPTTCRQTGHISIGRLVSRSNPKVFGPALFVAGGACKWKSGSEILRGCHPEEILAESPDAKLVEIKLYPSDAFEGTNPPLQRMVTCDP